MPATEAGWLKRQEEFSPLCVQVLQSLCGEAIVATLATVACKGQKSRVVCRCSNVALTESDSWQGRTSAEGSFYCYMACKATEPVRGHASCEHLDALQGRRRAEVPLSPVRSPCAEATIAMPATGAGWLAGGLVRMEFLRILKDWRYHPHKGRPKEGSGEASPMDEPRLGWADRPLMARSLSQPN